jgi:NAD(P)H-hydrate epimerase
MLRILTAEEMRRVDAHAIRAVGLPGPVLMESAGRSVFAEIRRRVGDLWGRRVAVVCGPGNNGGDGFVVARYLELAGVAVDCFLVGAARPATPDARRNFEIARKLGIPVRPFPRTAGPWDVVVDALFGTGLARRLGAPFAACLRRLNALPSMRIAVDLPSGLHADSGRILGTAFQADVTVALGFKKPGFFQNEGPRLCGEVVVADLSFDPRWADETGAARLFESEPSDVRGLFPPRSKTGHKGTYGHVLVVAGSPQKSGAAVLASLAALRGGAGLVTLAVPASAHTIVKRQLTEVMTEPLPEEKPGRLGPSAYGRVSELARGKQALVVGPGLLPNPGLAPLLARLFANTAVPVVLDADGLNAFGRSLAKLGRPLGRMVLTPHPGEMARLVGSAASKVQADRIGSARSYASKSGATVILKGAYSVVAAPDGETFVNPTGNPAMATAGMGDLLAGLLGAYLAQGAPLRRAAVAAAYHHGLAGDRAAARRGPRGLLASDLLDEFPRLPL